MMDFDFVINDVKWINSMNDHQKEIFDFPIPHSTPSFSRSNHQIRSVGFLSMKKHYDILTFLDYQLPIIYRLMNDSFYIPYIRFSYVLHIFEHSSSEKCLVNIRNLPLIEMTETERVYYNQLSSLNKDFDWSNSQLLSVSMLDGTLTIIDLIQNDSSLVEWRETRNRWTLDEIELNYKNNVGRQFIMTTKRQGGLVNDNIPCLIISQIILIPIDNFSIVK